MTMNKAGSDQKATQSFLSKNGSVKAEEKQGKKKKVPGILEEGLVYSCAGPRVGPDEACSDR